MNNKQLLSWISEINTTETDSVVKNSLIKYVNVCYERNLPMIINIEHFSYLIGIKYEVIKRMINSPNSFYYEFTIPKRSGGERKINKPYPSLMAVQKWINENILRNIVQHECATAYIPKKSIINHVQPHLKNNALLKIDIKDFFPSITLNRVISLFVYQGYPYHVAKFLGLLCTKNNELPQGAPTSPSISNSIFYKSDIRLLKLSVSLNLSYSRYADDMVFSGEKIYIKFVDYVKSILKEEGFVLNDKKTKLVIGENKQKIITGISISSGEMRLPRSKKRAWKKEIFLFLKNASTTDIIKINQILGKLHYWKQIEPQNKFVLDAILKVEKILLNME